MHTGVDDDVAADDDEDDEDVAAAKEDDDNDCGGTSPSSSMRSSSSSTPRRPRPFPPLLPLCAVEAVVLLRLPWKPLELLLDSSSPPAVSASVGVLTAVGR